MRRRLLLAVIVVLPLLVERRWSVQPLEVPVIDVAIPAELLALMLGLALGAAARSWWRVTGGYPSEPVLDVVEKHESAFREIGNAESIASATHQLFWERERWIYRRVEQIEFVERTMVRRRISIDFEVPAHALELEYGEGEDKKVVRFVPLSLLRSWPPVLNFDLQDQDGKPLSLVSRATTNAIDERVLKLLAESAMAEASPAVEQAIDNIVHREGPAARVGARLLSEGAQEFVEEREKRPSAETENKEIDLDALDRLLDLGAMMVDTTMLWIQVDGEVGERRIVKLSYDEPVRGKLAPIRRFFTSIGLASVVVNFEVPHIGDAGSYHLEILAPEQMEFTDARLVLSEDPTPPSRITVWRDRLKRVPARLESRIARRRGLPGPPEPAADYQRHRQLLTKRTHLYLAGERQRAFATASAWFLPERQGTVTAAATLSLAVAAVLLVFRGVADEIAFGTQPGLYGAAVGFLLLAPGLLTYVLLRRREHALVRRVLGASRFLAVSTALLPVMCAGLLILAVARKDPALLAEWTDRAVWASWVLLGTLGIAWLRPRGGRRRDD